MPVHKIQVLVGWTSLSLLTSAGLSLVSGSLQVVLLVVADTRREQVVHDNNADVDTPTLRGGYYLEQNAL